MRCDRREWLQAAGLGLLGTAATGWFPVLAGQLANHPQRKRHCILLWMVGGPSQTDTFDLKPGHVNGGEFKEISTNVAGIRFSEHLSQLAGFADEMAIVRSLSTREGDHERGTYLMRTGQPPSGPVQYPAIGSPLAKQLGSDANDLPNYVSIGGFRGLARQAFGPGFLGPQYGPLEVATANAPGAVNAATDDAGFAELRIDSLQPPGGIDARRFTQRTRLWNDLQRRFLAEHPNAPAAIAHDTIYRRSMRMMDGQVAQAFDLSREPDNLREAYGKGVFGQGCLLARRLIEYGVAFVEVTLGPSVGSSGWDTHADNFSTVKRLSAELQAGWATLMGDLRQRGLLESTTILWLGEFGRTPRINSQAGRDHFPQAWSCVFAGGGIRGGQVFGRTSADGMEVEENQVGVTDVLATLCAAVAVPPHTENYTADGRPIKIVDGQPIAALLK